MDADPVAGPDVGDRGGNQGPVDLGEKDVAARIELARVAELHAEVVGHGNVVDAVRPVRLAEEIGVSLEVAVRVERPERQARDRRGVG